MTPTIPSIDTLRHRIAINDCKAQYCYLIDDWELEALPSLFTEDTTLDYGGLGTYEGHEGVREFTEVIEETLERTTHLLTNPLIDVGQGPDIESEGDENATNSENATEDEPTHATGRWYVFSTITYADGSSGVRVGTYRDEYRRVDDQWLIAKSQLRFTHSVDYEDTDQNGYWPGLRAHSSSQS
ncbi:nuclear transport factor 2 family protein [Natronosalvus amylolyticus]|uniref:nuclear transport factor 2 family protein n=1 Tax=Natronosalvus amylolyticus TaxID=2961994 RepID=UPI0020C9CCC3|nr:nuclear transport factor 2 family protein [Natronosalvus amylolyticus]